MNDMLVCLGEPCIRSEAKKTCMLLLYTYVVCLQPNLLDFNFAGGATCHELDYGIKATSPGK
jgi:hypothetical protein